METSYSFMIVQYIPFIIIGTVLLIIFYGNYMNKKRKEGLNKLITDSGFNFEDVNSLIDSFGGNITSSFFRGDEINLSNTSIDIFSKGHSPKVDNIFSVNYNNGKNIFL